MTEREPETTPSSTAAKSPVYVGLLTQVMTNTLDEDYQVVSQRRAKQPDRARAGRRIGPLAVLVAFGVLAGVSALQTEQDAPVLRAERAELVAQIHAREARYDRVRGLVADLQTQLTGLQEQVADDANSDNALSGRLESLGVDAGTVAVSGPGVVLTVDDATKVESGAGGKILDTDLRQLVNALWQSGAEAVSVDGHRLSSLTSIRYAGRAITLDYRSLTPPYVITVVGDPDTLPARLAETAGGQMWLGLEVNFGVRYETETRDKVVVPADPHDRLLYAKHEVSR